MFIRNMTQMVRTLPATLPIVGNDGETYNTSTKDFTDEEWDAHGYNKYTPLRREPYHQYTTELVKGADFGVVETALTDVIDEDASDENLANVARANRDSLLMGSDWSQVADAPVDQAAWAAYRQALRDVPNQAGFPRSIVWPVSP